jgi:hypothetical protein
VGDRVWLQLNKERLQGHGKKIKALYYGHFEVLEKVGDNTYRLSLPPYMCIYSVVDVENLKLYDPSMLDQEEERVQVCPTFHIGLITRSVRRFGIGHSFAEDIHTYKTEAT